MAISKVTLNGTTLMDVTQDTVATNNLLTGETAHGADGEPVIGAYSGGGGGETTASQKDVNFIDFDGTIRYSYSASEFANLTALPANPSHSGLTAQGWNWSLADAKAEVAAHGKCDIGQMYVTTSGDTEIDIILQEGRLSPFLNLAVNGSVTIDWGDGSTSTLTGTSLTSLRGIKHNYANAGFYTIMIHVNNGSFAFHGSAASTLLASGGTAVNYDRVYANAVQAIRLGNNVSIGTYAFYYCASLTSVTIPSGVTSIDINAFYYCYSLASVTIPSGVTSISTSAFQYCYSLASVTIPSGVTSIGANAFYYCASLASVTIPSGVTSIGANAFRYCYSLVSIAIPDGVASINTTTFHDCCGLAKIRFEPTTPPTVSNSNAWLNIPTDCVISVPTGTLSVYTSATNYPSSSTYTYIEE